MPMGREMGVADREAVAARALTKFLGCRSICCTIAVVKHQWEKPLIHHCRYDFGDEFANRHVPKRCLQRQLSDRVRRERQFVRLLHASVLKPEARRTTIRCRRRFWLRISEHGWPCRLRL